MCKGEQTRVQGLTGEPSNRGSNRAAARNVTSGARAVDRIADQGVTAMGKMYPDLVRSAGGETTFDERCARVERALDTIIRDCRPSLTFSDNSHLLAVHGAATDVAGDLSGERVWHAPNNCCIGTVDATQRKIVRERAMRDLGFSDDHEPGRVLVEAMDDTRPAHAADPRKAHPAVADQGVDECAVWVPWRGVDNQPCGLIDDKQMCILEANIQRNRLCDRHGVSIIRENYSEILAAADPQRRVAQSFPFAHDMAGIDQPFESGARQRREMAGERAIKALSGFAGTGKDGYSGARRALFNRHDRSFFSQRGGEGSPD